MLHGSISNGKVFYSESGKGFACFLAKHGFTSYIIDMPGRGLSEPKLSRGVNPSQTEVIVDVIPQIQQFILSQHPDTKKVNWVGHSWGGVLMSAALLRFPELQKQVKTLVGFGTKRRLRAKSIKKFLMIDVFWKHISLLMIKKQGYLAADKYGLGMDNESEFSIKNQIPWLSKDWIDPVDGFNYQECISTATLPPCWFFAAVNDKVLGNPKDVKDSLEELQPSIFKFTLLGKGKGNKQDYDHASMLTHPDCTQDHFIELIDWYQKAE
nr:alpha/beta hydrolase [Parashewanella hymeniacidonis]